MPSEESRRRRQLFFSRTPLKERYTSPKHGRANELITQIRERPQHGQSLKTQVKTIQDSINDIKSDRRAKGYREDYGIYIEFESEEGFELKFESLENIKLGIEVENIRDVDGKTYATVYVPDGKLKYFLTKIDQYLEKSTPKTNKPKNKELIENISHIHLATLKAFWTGIGNFDEIQRDENRWWEIWIRTGNDSTERDQIENDFIEACSKNFVTIKDIKIKFPERTVYLAKTSVDVLMNSFTILNCLAEIRNPEETAEVFMGMPLEEQREWAEDLIQRTSMLSGNLPAICIIDTGINNGHPLLQVALVDEDKLTYNVAWGVDDPYGHGTEMAGIALYGDLFQQLTATESIQLTHKLESVKLYNDNHPHDPELYGAVTQECIYRAEVNAPYRRRVHCLAITSKENRYRGAPTSWSAAIDQVSFGVLDDPNNKRLILISAGNVDVFNQQYNYPDSNILDSIHDPGQSWNSLTASGYTQKNAIDTGIHGSLKPIAANNELAPSSTTSVMWKKKWPIKPEIVLESGNYAKDLNNSVTNLDSLRLLTTSNKPTVKLFETFGDTSAAVAQASRIAAIIQSQYSNYWPETIRGLLIHSAEWKAEMLSHRNIRDLNATEKNNILRKYGYGVPDLEKAMWCANNFSTLIIQQDIKPFIVESNEVKTNEVNFHSLPWPKDFFQELSSVNIRLKITLSYFIEPNPTHRKFFGKYDYASHGLRFDLKKGTETIEDFKRRINKKAREENDETSYIGLTNWSLGSQTRNVGSVHSDTLNGTAATLADMDTIAIYPVSGWWRIRKRLKRWDNSVRYSLIISLEVEEPEIDIYTPIYNIVHTPIIITTSPYAKIISETLKFRTS